MARVHATPGKAQVERLYQEHGAALLLFATAIVGEQSRAQDAVHQVFLRMLERGDLGRASDPKAYLFASVRNAVLNDERARRRNVALDREALWFDPPTRDHAAERNLQRALAALPAEQREVIILHLWGELTFTQIADVLDLSLNTAASRYRYALAKLREVMCVEEHCCE
jgi:RNA polymerase sigma-70 factor, ECF subfamily